MKGHFPLLRGLVLLALAIPGLALGGQCSPVGGTKNFDFAFNYTFSSPEKTAPRW